MDALAAVLMPGFKESSWTDQEVGIAIGRGVLVIPILRGMDPYAFIAKFQGLNASGKMVSQVAEEIFRILLASPRTRARMLSCLLETTLQSKSEGEALFKLNKLADVVDLPGEFFQRLQEGAPASSVLMGSALLQRLNALLAGRGLTPVGVKKSPRTLDDDIPF